MATRRRTTGVTSRTTDSGRTPTQNSPGGILGSKPHSMDSLALMEAAMGGAKVPEMSLHIPEDATLPQVEETLTVCIGGYKSLTEAAEKLKPFIGRLLLVIKTRTLFKPGFKDFTDYVDQVIVRKMGMSSTNAFEALRIARAFPNMDATAFARYGASRLLLATQATKEADPNHKAILEESLRMTVAEFKQNILAAKAQATGDAGAAVDTSVPMHVSVSIKCTPDLRDRWQALLNATGLSAEDLFSRLLALGEANPTTPLATLLANSSTRSPVH